MSDSSKLKMKPRRSVHWGAFIVCAVALSWTLFATPAHAVTAPCGSPYGTPANQAAIDVAMYSGTQSQVVTAINNAKNTRDDEVGCAESSTAGTLYPATVPTLSAIQTAWRNNHAASINNFVIPDCPTIGRQDAGRALGGYYARLAGETVSLTGLSRMGDEYVAQLNTPANASTPPPSYAYRGAAGYLSVPATDVCYQGAVTDAANTFCTNAPALCVLYSGGRYAGRRFLIGDIVPSQGVYDGGIAYDQGFVGAMFMEASIQQSNSTLRTRYRNAAIAAGEWAINEPPVRNHNYTAKLVWILAQLYARTGEARWRTALLDKLNRNLLPGMLTDVNGDGNVDGMSPAQPFAGLERVAQTPGRYWDGHNAVAGYQAMNAWALVEAYVALRDRGQPEANTIRPYAFAALDNLARQVNTYGVAQGPGLKELPIAFLLALWKIERYEPSEQGQHNNWVNAAWRLWNVGFATQPYGDNTINIGLYLVYRSNTPYVPLANR